MELSPKLGNRVKLSFEDGAEHNELYSLIAPHLSRAAKLRHDVIVAFGPVDVSPSVTVQSDDLNAIEASISTRASKLVGAQLAGLIDKEEARVAVEASRKLTDYIFDHVE